MESEHERTGGAAHDRGTAGFEDLRSSTTRLRMHLAERQRLADRLDTGDPPTNALLRNLLGELSQRTAEIAEATDVAAGRLAPCSVERPDGEDAQRTGADDAPRGDRIAGEHRSDRN